jgi:hypothetical protein
MVREGTEHRVSVFVENQARDLGRPKTRSRPADRFVLAYNTFKRAGVILYVESRQKGGTKYLA